VFKHFTQIETESMHHGTVELFHLQVQLQCQLQLQSFTRSVEHVCTVALSASFSKAAALEEAPVGGHPHAETLSHLKLS